MSRLGFLKLYHRYEVSHKGNNYVWLTLYLTILVKSNTVLLMYFRNNYKLLPIIGLGFRITAEDTCIWGENDMNCIILFAVM